jgi:acetolactate synthase I/II/III large subunit
VQSAQEMAEASLAAVAAALGPPCRVASLIVPADCQWEPGAAALSEKPAPTRHEVGTHTVAEAARLLGRSAVLFLGGDALTERGLHAAARVAVATGCGVLIETFASRQARGRHVPDFPALPYFPEQARPALAPFAHVVLAGARAPVAVFGYPDQPSRFVADGSVTFTLADPDAGADAVGALEALADEVKAPAAVPVSRRGAPAFAPAGRPLDPDNLGRAVSAFTPEHAIVVNEAATTGMVWSAKYAASAAPHTVLGLTGGSIGIGLPLALGAALACPDRRLIAFQADGSGFYTLQALWSMARESADVTVVVCANRRYRVLQTELAHVTDMPGPKARSLTDLSHPAVDWVELAKGFGVPGWRAQTDTELAAALTRALAGPGPSLIEAVLA